MFRYICSVGSSSISCMYHQEYKYVICIVPKCWMWKKKVLKLVIESGAEKINWNCNFQGVHIIKHESGVTGGAAIH